VTGGVAGFGVGGVLTGAVDLTGNTAIEFVSGNINAIATGATLYLNGNNAYVEDSTALGSNSALNLSNVSGNLELYNGASISVAATTGNPTGALLNSGGLYVDNSQAGSSSLKVAGKLTNLGIFEATPRSPRRTRRRSAGSPTSARSMSPAVRSTRPRST